MKTIILNKYHKKPLFGTTSPFWASSMQSELWLHIKARQNNLRQNFLHWKVTLTKQVKILSKLNQQTAPINERPT